MLTAPSRALEKAMTPVEDAPVSALSPMRQRADYITGGWRRDISNRRTSPRKNHLRSLCRLRTLRDSCTWVTLLIILYRTFLPDIREWPAIQPFGFRELTMPRLRQKPRLLNRCAKKAYTRMISEERSFLREPGNGRQNTAEESWSRDRKSVV